MMFCEFRKNLLRTYCFEVFAKFSDMTTSANIKYAHTQCCKKVSIKKNTQIENRKRTRVSTHKETYRRVSSLNSTETVQKFEKKGIIFIWPQRKRIYYSTELIFITWFLSHAFFWLHTLNLFPSGTNLALEQPLWNYVPPAKKPERRDFIIEPDWGSQNV